MTKQKLLKASLSHETAEIASSAVFKRHSPWCSGPTVIKSWQAPTGDSQTSPGPTRLHGCSSLIFPGIREPNLPPQLLTSPRHMEDWENGPRMWLAPPSPPSVIALQPLSLFSNYPYTIITNFYLSISDTIFFKEVPRMCQCKNIKCNLLSVGYLILKQSALFHCDLSYQQLFLEMSQNN